MAVQSIKENLTSTGNTDLSTWNGRLGAFLVSGTFDGATVKLQHKVGSVYVDLGPDTTLTSDGGGQFITPQNNLRVNVSGGSGSIDVDVVVKPLVI